MGGVDEELLVGCGDTTHPWAPAPITGGVCSVVGLDQRPTDAGCRRRDPPLAWVPMSKKTKKKKARMRRSKANHGKRPNMGRG